MSKLIDNMKIIRVFPEKTNYTPIDDYVFIGMPPFIIPEHDEVHISCAFTWDREYAKELKFQWEGRTDKPVKLGGVAFNSPVDDFIQGLYVKSNVIFTTRGCNNNCPWCIVPKQEGKLRELPICQGNIIQDNNFLQASRQHKEKVFDMLRTQKGICFKGGLEPGLIDDHFIDSITSLKIKELWLACDTNSSIPLFKKASSLILTLKISYSYSVVSSKTLGSALNDTIVPEISSEHSPIIFKGSTDFPPHSNL